MLNVIFKLLVAIGIGIFMFGYVTRGGLEQFLYGGVGIVLIFIGGGVGWVAQRMSPNPGGGEIREGPPQQSDE